MLIFNRNLLLDRLVAFIFLKIVKRFAAKEKFTDICLNNERK